MSQILYGIQVWGLHCRPTVLRKVQSVQTNVLKWVTGKYNASLRELLHDMNWMSVYQLAIFHSIILQWKVRIRGKPERLLRRINDVEYTEARLNLTERTWSRISTKFFRMFEAETVGILKILVLKRTLSNWFKANVPITED